MQRRASLARTLNLQKPKKTFEGKKIVNQSSSTSQIADASATSNTASLGETWNEEQLLQAAASLITVSQLTKESQGVTANAAKIRELETSLNLVIGIPVAAEAIRKEITALETANQKLAEEGRKKFEEQQEVKQKGKEAAEKLQAKFDKTIENISKLEKELREQKNKREKYAQSLSLIGVVLVNDVINPDRKPNT